MKRNNTWKWFFVVFVVAWSFFEVYPPNSKDLIAEFEARASNKDATFAEIMKNAREMDKTFPDRDYGNLRVAIGTNDIVRYFAGIKIPEGETETTRVILNRVQKDAAGKIKLGLDLQGGTSFLVELDTTKLEGTNAVSQTEGRERALSQAVEVLRKRVDKFGVSEPVILPAGDNQILIQMPGLLESEKQSARNQLEKAAFLEFRMVHPQSDELVSQGLTEPGYELLYEKRKDKQGVVKSYGLLVKRKAEKGLTGSYVKSSGVSPNYMTGEPEIHLTFNDQGARLFAEITRENVNRRMGIVLDGVLYSAPNINEEIPSGRAQIHGSFDLKEAFELANVLENPLEAPVKIKEERGVDPSLGKDSIASGVRSAIMGTIAVMAFMLVYYMFAGVVANVALLLNIIVLLGVMCSVGTTLTLPGIAGIVLTIGMAVDANVLIFERIREELEAGKSIRGALNAGYDKAFGTIFDSNLTTLISSVILIYMGTGAIKGFGVTLTIGISVSMFTALLVTRLMFDWLLAKEKISTLKMLHLVRDTKIDFLSHWKPAFGISWGLIVIGLIVGISRGSSTLGVDFAGGDQLTLKFAKKVENVDQLREELKKTVKGDPTIQYGKDIVTGKETLRIITPFDSGDAVEKALKEKFTEAKFERIAIDKVGPSVGREILRSALVSVLLSLFGILIYVAMRYEFSFAVAAVVAVIHDVLMTLGWFVISGREFSAPMVAAVLTIIGFSINDTIVIFDRIREDLKLGIKGSLKDVMNMALNQTLSRTIITSGTVFIATLSLYLFGGGVINDFAFTFLAGIITGTYSSIYIASALVLWWHKGERPKSDVAVAADSGIGVRVS